MTDDRELSLILDRWFADGPTEMPDRVIHVVATGISRQRQRPAWRLDRRLLRMNTPMRAIAGLAAVALVAVVGFNLIGGPAAGVGGPPPTPSPTATPVVTPIPMPSGTLAAGTYALSVYQDPRLRPFPKFIITLPDGWEQGNDIISHADPHSGTIVFWQVDELYADPCRSSLPRIKPGPTVDDLASAMTTIPLRNATTPVAVTVGGYTGKYLEWSVPDNAGLSDGVAPLCDEVDGIGRFMSFIEAAGGYRYQQEPGQVDRIWILDVSGVRIVIDAHFAKDASEADRAELSQIVNSVRFEPAT